MPRLPPADALLCEGCGYPIDGAMRSDPVARCPECARPVADSLPARRVGSRWQRRMTPATWLRANVETVASPIGRWREVRIEAPRSLALLAINLALAAAIFPGAHLWLLADLRNAAMGASAMLALLALLVAVEWAGIRFFGRLRGWRITGRVAIAICAYASIGWLAIAPAFLPLAAVTALTADALEARWLDAHRLEVATLGAFFVGMLAFEALVYAGFRACRFANQPTAKQGDGLTRH